MVTRIHSIVELMPDGIVIASLDGHIRFANPAAQQLFGRSEAALIGADLGIPLTLGKAVEMELVRPGGETVAVELRTVEIEWDDEHARLVSLRDVTDRKRAQERAAQLERERLARAEAEAASLAKSEFLATMSHELRTPLNAVIGYSDLLDLSIAGELTPDQRRQVGRIRESARHLLGLVNEVLDLAKVEAGSLVVQNRRGRASAVLDAALSLVQTDAEERGIRLVAEALEGDVAYLGDDDRIRQILVNLLGNAVKFTPAGGEIRIACRVVESPTPGTRLQGSGPWVCFTVTDTGVGIPGDRLSSIFDPFVQVETGHRRPSDGSGLGLTISRKLARLMDGDLAVTSELGKGSTFTLWLRESSMAARESGGTVALDDSETRVKGLSDVGDVLLRNIGSLINSLVARIRNEVVSSPGDALRDSQLADHMAPYIADLAAILIAIEEARGHPTRLVSEGSDILSYIAERHGAQRSRLGWSADLLRREWRILRDEIQRILGRGAARLAESTAAEARIVIERFIDQGEETSVRALYRSSPSQSATATPLIVPSPELSS